ncbi:MAG: hypothetical protein Q8L41_13195 [Anaerolineales bacterium]|nr:hypothetical protein [Anaerolineales bacterium]
MSKVRITKRKKDEKSREWPAVVYFWMIGLAFASYVVARIVLDAYSHPYHWLSGLAGGLAGVLIGWLWYRRRGDVF